MKLLILIYSLISFVVDDAMPSHTTKLVSATEAYYAVATITNINSIHTYKDLVKQSDIYPLVSYDLVFIIDGGKSEAHKVNLNDTISVEDYAKLKQLKKNDVVLIDNMMCFHAGIYRLMGAVAYKVI